MKTTLTKRIKWRILNHNSPNRKLRAPRQKVAMRATTPIQTESRLEMAMAQEMATSSAKARSRNTVTMMMMMWNPKNDGIYVNAPQLLSMYSPLSFINQYS